MWQQQRRRRQRQRIMCTQNICTTYPDRNSWKSFWSLGTKSDVGRTKKQTITVRTTYDTMCIIGVGWRGGRGWCRCCCLPLTLNINNFMGRCIENLATAVRALKTTSLNFSLSLSLLCTPGWLFIIILGAAAAASHRHRRVYYTIIPCSPR